MFAFGPFLLDLLCILTFKDLKKKRTGFDSPLPTRYGLESVIILKSIFNPSLAILKRSIVEKIKLKEGERMYNMKIYFYKYWWYALYVTQYLNKLSIVTIKCWNSHQNRVEVHPSFWNDLLVSLLFCWYWFCCLLALNLYRSNKISVSEWFLNILTSKVLNKPDSRE